MASKNGTGNQPREKMSKRILVVDDESDVCMALEKILDEHGFTVDSYKNPLLAFQKFKADLYDLVILDIKMPELNGFVLYREIKSLDKKVKVCFLTAGEMYYGVYSDIFSSLHANYFIRKPIDNEILLKRINEIIFDDTTICVRTK
jgi:DNA-binding response OmpR family regulator